ncbi:phospholipase B1, membrane-associated-like [Topomyia yanbarensis]|uniref:phospholipase B1, membrane-associated-like n=1 Tax=Topomyia yanbarensis TaxID=2498891 RepID=UPI00273B6B6D|nr:phospholipase B1, membrane-associated-like [Topomyia yanbarensis]XP_058832472.1 phospholipase B1, membrane-associated-like [Topomyia yanbarensis]XP_058832473.1 phospholipase B1, membrane-associated-like [Topomyia yanbarensis]XP_058832474.1 phospholipase B1, membrane-associated-like [Topomyia yanbarensis]
MMSTVVSVQKISVYFIVFVMALFVGTVPIRDITDQKTSLDTGSMLDLFHTFRKWMFNFVGRTSLRAHGYYMQEKIPDDLPFPCNISLGRSMRVPKSVHKLRPGDINVIAAMGDSLTAASGAASISFVDLYMENRGLAWSIGGQWNWRNVTTLPNILKEFNPKLIGYSLGDSYPFHRETQFNMAEIGAVSYDMPFMARSLVKRIRSDPRVDFKRDWKLITISIGGNDICSFVCTMQNPEDLPEKHRLRMIKALQYLRDNMPRTLVNLVSIPSVETVVSLNPKPPICQTLHYGECSCWVGKLYNQSDVSRTRWRTIQEKMAEVEEEVVKMDEFRRLDEFAAIHQPWSTKLSLKMNGRDVDYSLLAYDCFHMSQKGNAYAGTALWNNMLQAVGKKSRNWKPLFEDFRCPTAKEPYIFTYDNS